MNHDERRSALETALRDGARPGQLAKACLLVAQGEYPHLDPELARDELRHFSSDLRLRMEDRGEAPWEALQALLGGREGFGGTNENFDDPRNSYLNDVLERRAGLPILMSVVWVEVARGARIVADGVALPGHFIASIGQGEARRFVDPFAGGPFVAPEDALRRGAIAAGKPDAADPAWLEPAQPDRILLRVLENLAGSYERRGDMERLERIVSDQLAIAPTNPGFFARRAATRLHLGNRAGGLSDLNEVLAHAPPGAFRESVRDRAHRIARQGISVN